MWPSVAASASHMLPSCGQFKICQSSFALIHQLKCSWTPTHRVEPDEGVTASVFSAVAAETVNTTDWIVALEDSKIQLNFFQEL